MGNTPKTSWCWSIKKKKKKSIGDNNWFLEDSFLIDSCPRGLFILFFFILSSPFKLLGP